jgi:hypothetical protein
MITLSPEGEEDSITLSPDELGNITGDDEEEDSITLSPDELGNITGDVKRQVIEEEGLDYTIS